jgi:endonuclease/exonuclease/phosphatase family metal-dependent hydrolase
MVHNTGFSGNPILVPLMSIPRSLFLVLSLFLVASCAEFSVQIKTEAEGKNFPADSSIKNNNQHNNNGALKILSLNVAHGRKDAVNQMLVSTETIQLNLTEIAGVLSKENADVVALQEADGPSGWSGNFDHVASIAKQAGYPWYYRADHARSWLFSYGTAILSQWPISETLEHTFKPSPPTLNKGFLISRMIWKPNPEKDKEVQVDIVSVHLDFSRQKVREKQIAEMAEALSKRNNPMIILGDFNSDWFSEESVVQELADKAQMKVYEPHADNLHTYVKGGKRLDWILISNELEFVSYKVLPDIISDHLAVAAEVKLVE